MPKLRRSASAAGCHSTCRSWRWRGLRRFNPELPNPYPGENQSKWGYPITLKLGEREVGGTPVVTMTLREGSATGPVVACHLSSPQAPGNPMLAPILAWCLIPKRTLKAGTKYLVHAEIAGAKPVTLDWSFTTGRQASGFQRAARTTRSPLVHDRCLKRLAKTP